MPSKLHSSVAFLARRPGLCVLIVFVTLSVGWEIQNILQITRRSHLELSTVDYIAKFLDVKMGAGDNLDTTAFVKVTFTNTGYRDITFGQWRLYFNTFGSFTTREILGLELKWVNGGLYYLSPIEGAFRGISAGNSMRFTLEGWRTVARSDHFPNWYVASSSYGITSPKLIESTTNDSLAYVSAFNTPNLWKRHALDMYNPYTPEQRYKLNNLTADDNAKNSVPIIPTPYLVKLISSGHLTVDNKWVVVQHADSQQESISKYLAKNLGLNEVRQPPSGGHYFEFKQDSSLGQYEYRISTYIKEKIILILSSDPTGTYYGVQTILSMFASSKNIPDVTIQDMPRFAYRGLMLDVSRNFHKKESVKTVIDMMATYKLNKLHLHLTDDEGWRIEIPALPELTRYGSRRCHYFETEKCLIPSLGSGPYSNTSGSGFYTVSDFREILRYATERYIEVIPEIDVPGHAAAAISAMQFRAKDIEENQATNNYASYLLSDDMAGSPSVQGWLGNAMNPCLNSSYMFMDTVIEALQTMYQGIAKLDLIHIGGDEVSTGAWTNSPACNRLFHGRSHNAMKRTFMLAIADIADRRGLKIAAWEDGIYNQDKDPYSVTDFKQKEVYINTWNNPWENGRSGRGIELADAGFKVVLSMATHLYFDHPYEPDPEETGLYWATRYIDTHKTFGFMPMDIFANADFDRNGNELNGNNLCGGTCPKTHYPGNFVGMEACVWSETIRTENQLHSMLFPRILAMAERAWHRAAWEDIHDVKDREMLKEQDWARFVHILGNHELSKLEKAGVMYRVPPPGIMLTNKNRTLLVNTLYPGHVTMVSFGNGGKWQPVSTEVNIPEGTTDIKVRSISPLLKRNSRQISLHVSTSVGSGHTFKGRVSSIYGTIASLLLLKSILS